MMARVARDLVVGRYLGGAWLRGACLMIVAASCGFDPLPRLTDAGGLVVDGAEPGIDGAGPGGDGSSMSCHGDPQGLVTPCFAAEPTGELTLLGVIDTTSDVRCSTTVLNVPSSVCVIAAANIHVADGMTVTVIGTRPLVLVAAFTISIGSNSVLDAASHRSSVNPEATAQVGAGSDPAGGCDPGDGPLRGVGGAGGSFGAPGGNGGSGEYGDGGGTSGAYVTSLSLRGGCSGQSGSSDGGSGGGRGLGGHGGGVVYLIARTILNSGIINASGEGGGRGHGGNAPAGGGGSGGLIGLDAPTITNFHLVFANGGGGGEGADGPSAGLPGPEAIGVRAANGASGGSFGGDGGVGGAGGPLGGTASGGNGGSSTADGGGGGGGSVGMIKVYRGTLGGSYSPFPRQDTP